MAEKTVNEQPEPQSFIAIAPGEKPKILDKLNARVEEHLKDCPFDVRVDLVPCQTFSDPWSKLRAKSDAEWDEFRRATLEDRWPVVFELPDGTERKMKYRSVEEGEDGALAFTGVEFADSSEGAE